MIHDRSDLQQSLHRGDLDHEVVFIKIAQQTIVARLHGADTISTAGAGARAAQGSGLQSRTVAGSNPARRSSARGLPQRGGPRCAFQPLSAVMAVEFSVRDPL